MPYPIATIIMFSADRYTVISVSDIGQNTEISEKNIIMIKLDGFFRTILKDIVLAMSFKNIMLDAARLARYFVKLIARPISFCIMLNPSNFISNLVRMTTDMAQRCQMNLTLDLDIGDQYMVLLQNKENVMVPWFGHVT